MNTYFRINYGTFSKHCSTMSKALDLINNMLNEDRKIPFNIEEVDTASDRVIIEYRPEFSSRLVWTDIPKYDGATLI